ncbi:putative COP9 signalosome complex subunit 4-like [Capsicum annuum]|nr:putative COP9 signalosome complex subunit 4-like [Capsicum annuum]
MGSGSDYIFFCLNLDISVGDHQETVPVEGVAGGGTAYGWSDTGVNDPRPLRGAIDPMKVSSLELLNVWCMPNSANVGPQDMPRELEPISLLAARNERESIQIAIRPKVSWGGSGIAGTVQVQCTDLCSPCGARLVVGQSLTLRRVVPVLGVPDALVPLDMPVCQLNLFPGETTVIWISVDVPSEQTPGHYEGEIIISATKSEAESTSQSLTKVEKHQLYRELRDCLDVVEPLKGRPSEEVVERVKSATSSLRRVLLSPSFADFFSDYGPIDMMEEDAVSSLSIRLKISLTVWDFVLPVTPSVPAVIGVSFFIYWVRNYIKPLNWLWRISTGNKLLSIEFTLFSVCQISDTVIEDRFGVEHGTNEWFELLDQHFKWLLQYRISPYFCRWGNGMRVLTYTSPWPADHPKSDEYFSDPRLAAYAVPNGPIVPCGDTAKDYLRREVEILRTKNHWKKAYFYLWDEPLNIEQYNGIRSMASEIHAYAPDARILTTYYCGPSDAPLASNNFEAFLKVPEFLRPHTQIYCTRTAKSSQHIKTTKPEDAISYFMVFTGKCQDISWHLTGVYAPSEGAEREETSWEIGAARGLVTGSWILCGDFNIVRHPSEKKNCSRINKGMIDFSDFIEDMELVDIELSGGKYSWKKGDRHITTSRLDKILFFEEWASNFRNISQNLLPRVTSDHSPIMLQCGDWETTKSYFKFENWWLETDGFKERVKGCKTFSGNLRARKQEVLRQLAELEETQEHRALEAEEITSRLTLNMKFEDVANREKIAYRQRSRAVWLKQGDRNTDFFHRIANAHRSTNTIDKLKVRGVILTKVEEVHEEIISYSKKLYSELEDWRPHLDVRNCPMIGEEENSLLMAPFGQQEILESIKACAGDKAPGPDGFSMAFFSQCWETINTDLVAALQNFHKEEIFEKSINASFVVLIPKKVGAMELKDFRPISLIGGVYKIIAKLMAERLKKVIHSLMAKERAWIRGFQVGTRATNNLEITHLQYADDTLVFCEAEKDQMLFLRVIFIIFEVVFGLHINWGKSFIYPINEVVEVDNLAAILGGRVGELPTIYLGMPLGAKSKSKGIWNGVIEKCEKKLTHWKSQHLSLGGNEDKKKFHLVKWVVVTKSKKRGGMGIRDMKMHKKEPNDKMALEICYRGKYVVERGHGWNLQLRRNLNDWEMKSIGSFYNTMESFNNLTGEWVIGNREDLAKDIIAEIQTENGEEWWTYVCLGPGDPHPNWHLGMRGTQHRAVMWRVWKEGGTGFLYWGANCYEKATVPSAEIKFRRGLPPGDGVLFYPGQVFSSSQQPVASLRLERLLSGLQDIEYLKLYASRFGRDESLNLLEKTGMYQGPERYTSEHTPIDIMRGEVYRTCRS